MVKESARRKDLLLRTPGRPAGTTRPNGSPIDADDVFLTVADVAERLKLNDETVRRLFVNGPGVVVICFPKRERRVYRTLRIPEKVFQRVLTRFTTAAERR